MKAFVIKNKEGKYWNTSFDYEGKPLLTDDIVDAMPYDDFDIQMVKCPKDCEVVEITIAEGDLEKENKVLNKALYWACNYIIQLVDKDVHALSHEWADYFIEQAKKGEKE